MSQKQMMAKFMGANVRVALGVAFIFAAVVFGSTFGGPGGDASVNERASLGRRIGTLLNSRVSARTRAEPPDDSPEATIVISGNNAPITINDNAAASLYPSVAMISGVNPSITRVRVQLNNFSHTFPDDVDVILEGPQGQRSIIMSDAGGAADVSNITLTFDSTAALSAVLPDESLLATGTYRAVNYGNGGTDTFPFPFPAPNTLTDAPADLSVFNLTNPNGQWKLYVVDDAGQDTGTISGGWTLFVTVPAIFTVNSTNDPGSGVCDASECTLREAITAAVNATGSSDLVNFSAVFNTAQTINLLTALPDVTESMAIQGPGANLLTVRRSFAPATPDFRIFTIPSGITAGVAISGMTITGGRAQDSGFGGGILSQSSLTLTNVAVTGNQAIGGGGVSLAFADGVFSGCTFNGNTATILDGGGITFNGGGGRTLRLINSTVSGNSSAAATGGGIINLSGDSNSRLEVTGSTIAGNTAGNGGGISMFTFGGALNTATTTLRNTIIANNTPTNLASGTNGGGAATFQSLGFNLSDNFTGGGFTPLASDVTSSTPRLGPLSLGGGTTPTHALLGGSPAYNVGDASGYTTDQRGQPRVFGTGADIGAVEMRPLIVTNTTDSLGAGTLRQAITDANANGPGLDDIIFGVPPFSTPQTISLLSALPNITGSTTINGPAANLLTVRRDPGAADFRIFNIAGGITGGVALSGMTINNGRAPGNFGGGIFSTSNLTLTNVHVTGNQATNGTGGGVSLVFADGVFTGCTFSSNMVTNGGGGIFYQGNGGHTLRLVSSTVSGNSANMGGGIFNVSSSGNNNSRLEVVSSTIANNPAGNGILTFTQFDTLNTATTTLRNTIIANNTPNNLTTGTAGGGAATVTTNGFNLANDNGGGFLNVPPMTTDKINANAGLAPLDNNFGATLTRALLPGSEALDAGNNSGSGTLTDQRGRGFRRPFDLPLPNGSGDGTDIGAFEAQTAPAPPSNCPNPTLTIAEDQNTSPGGLLVFGVTPQAGIVIVDHVNAGTGLQSLTTTAVTNASVTIPGFTPGTFSPVTTTFTSPNPALPTDFTLRAANSTQGILIRAQCSPPPTISINDFSLPEGNSGITPFTFVVNLSAASEQTVTVSYATADGTTNPASAGSDYTAIGATTLTFTAGQTMKFVTVSVNGDTTVEPDETFFVNLSNATNATISDNQGLGTIVNDDAACTYALSPASPQSVPAATSNLNVTVTTPAGCAWTATTTTPWITINSGSSGNGNGTVNMTFAANTGAARSGSLTIAGQTYTVNQTAGTPTPSPSPSPTPGCPAAVPILYGATVNGTLQAGDCLYTDNTFYDAYTFSGTTGQQIAVAMNSTALNSFLFLIQGAYPGGTFLAQDNNGGGGLNARIPANSGFFTLPATGTYTILANAFAVGETGAYSLTLQIRPATAFDYDADRKTDLSVFRPSEGAWYLQQSTAGFFGMLFGFSTDKITPADFDGDGKTDIAVFRPSDQRWYIANSRDGTFSTFVFGLANDIPAPADYDGDGKADLCLFRPSDGTWYLQRSSNGTFFARQFGANGDKPTIGDFDADGKSDLAVFRTSNGEWYQIHSSDNSIHGEQFGFTTDKLAYADYDGDGRTDMAVFRPSERVFYIKNSATATYSAFVFGLAADIPTPGDYDGDGKADLSVFRPSDGNWYRQNSSNGSFNAFNFGLAGDQPTPTAFH